LALNHHIRQGYGAS